TAPPRPPPPAAAHQQPDEPHPRHPANRLDSETSSNEGLQRTHVPGHVQPAPAAVPSPRRSTYSESRSHRSHSDVILLQRARDGDQQARNVLVERDTPVSRSNARMYPLPTT